MSIDPQILKLIPHRPPFLWVNRIIELTDEEIVTETTFPDDLDIFKGHYPGRPILPGVILCETIFQSGALLMAKITEGQPIINDSSVPVLTRIGGARFKRQILPGETVTTKVILKETLSSVAFFKGTLRTDSKVAVQVDFSCTLTPKR